MADTVRTLAQLLIAAADNTMGNYNLQNLRDFIVTVASWTKQVTTIVSLDVAVVTTGGTAVTALSAGHRTAGGWISNPPTATTNLGINEVGTASGTTSSGNTTFIAPGQTYTLTPSANAVSVISSDSGHVFSGYGFQ